MCREACKVFPTHGKARKTEQCCSTPNKTLSSLKSASFLAISCYHTCKFSLWERKRIPFGAGCFPLSHMADKSELSTCWVFASHPSLAALQLLLVLPHTWISLENAKFPRRNDSTNQKTKIRFSLRPARLPGIGRELFPSKPWAKKS